MSEIEALAKLIPEQAMNQLAQTFCSTLEKVIYPITATTEGIGKLIEQRFKKLNYQQQIIAEKCFEEIEEKVKRITKSKHVVIKPTVVYEALDNTEQQTDMTMRALWSNLLAREFSEGTVHPEIAKLLSKVTSQDALLLHQIAQKETTLIPVLVLKAIASSFMAGLLNKKRSFNHVYLNKLGLIQEVEHTWRLTITGREFMRCVGDIN